MTTNGLAFGASVVLALSCLAGCGPGWIPVDYAPQPSRVEDPRADLRELVLSNSRPGCVTRAEWVGEMLLAQWACVGFAGNASLRPSLIETVELQRHDDWWRVHVVHRDERQFILGSPSADEARRVVDAVEALRQRHAPSG